MANSVDDILEILEEIQEKLDTPEKIDQKGLIETDSNILNEINNQNVNIANQLIELSNDVKQSNRDSSKCSEKLKEVEKKLQGIKTLKIINRHHFLIFPDLRNWLYLVKRTYVVLVLVTILIVSLAFNVYQRAEVTGLKPLASKYRIANAFAIKKNVSSNFIFEYFTKLDSIYPLQKDQLLKSTQIIEDSIQVETLRKRKIKSLQEELNKLKE